MKGNKEIVSHSFLTADIEGCIGCGLCASDCPQHCISIEAGKVSVDETHCIRCGHCIAICPQNVLAGPEPVTGINNNALDPDAVMDFLKQRRTVRQFLNQPVTDDITMSIIEAGRYAHTGRNRQGLSFIILDDQKCEAERLGVEYFRMIKKAGRRFSEYLRWKKVPDDFFFRGAPLVIVITGRHVEDAVFAAANMELAAQSYGLGVMISGFFTIAANHFSKIRKILGISGGNKALVTMVIGYPAVKYLRTVSRDEPRVIRK